MHCQKGFNYLFEALVGTPYKKVRMVCAGDPNHPDFIRPYKDKLNLEHYHIYTPFDKALSLLSECEIIVIPSINHSSGMFGSSGSIRTAITSGRPVICTTATHFEEFHNEMPKALTKNVLDLKDKIVNLMGNEQKQNEIIEKLKQYQEEHAIGKFVENYNKIVGV